MEHSRGGVPQGQGGHHLLGPLPTLPTKDESHFLGCEHTLSAYAQPSSAIPSKNFPGLLSIPRTSQGCCLSLLSSACVIAGLAPAQTQGFALHLVEPHEVPMGPFLGLNPFGPSPVCSVSGV